MCFNVCFCLCDLREKLLISHENFSSGTTKSVLSVFINSFFKIIYFVRCVPIYSFLYDLLSEYTVICQGYAILGDTIDLLRSCKAGKPHRL